jgi:hypothetical protein
MESRGVEMGKNLKRLSVAAGAAAMLLAASAPAQAHDDAGVAIAAGLLGLGIGAAIASNHHHHRHYYDEDGYYAPPPPPTYSYEYLQRCRVVESWDPYEGGYERHRSCD